MEQVGTWLKKYGECIYGCGEVTQGVLAPWAMTRKGDDAYVILSRYPGASLTIGKHNLPFAIPRTAELLGHDQSIVVDESPRNYRFIGLPAASLDPLGSVIKFKAQPLTAARSTYSIGEVNPEDAVKSYMPGR
jgi:hypothetical protein